MGKGDPDAVVPIFLKEVTHISYADGDKARRGERIAKIAGDSERDVHSERTIPDELRRTIEDDDATLVIRDVPVSVAFQLYPESLHDES